MVMAQNSRRGYSNMELRELKEIIISALTLTQQYKILLSILELIGKGLCGKLMFTGMVNGMILLILSYVLILIIV
jgi:hypothetical protein